MKSLLVTTCALVMASSFTPNLIAQVSAGTNEIKEGAVIEFNKDTHDYGEVEYEGDGYCTFEFTNTGTEPLIIADCKGSCGCTIPDWPKTPIAPGETGSIKVKYDTTKVGAINRSVTITSNATNTPTKVVQITGLVKPKPADGIPLNISGPGN